MLSAELRQIAALSEQVLMCDASERFERILKATVRVEVSEDVL